MSTSSSTNSSATSTSQANENKNLTSKKWTWVKTTISGTSTLPKKINTFSMTLNATGTVYGATDCNNYFGSYKTDSNKLTFGPFGSTRKFCEDSQETEFMSVLQKVTEYSIDKSNNLILNTGSGTMMFK
jgi:heat shock protein HslJ